MISSQLPTLTCKQPKYGRIIAAGLTFLLICTGCSVERTGSSTLENSQINPSQSLGDDSQTTFPSSVAGSLLGGAWGAGTGAVIGQQAGGASGEGLVIGTALGAIGGGLSGVGHDRVAARQQQLTNQLNSLRAQNQANTNRISEIQAALDYPSSASNASQIFQVFFDPDATSVRAGSAAELELIAVKLTKSPHTRRVLIRGHSDDSGTPDYNLRISEARARSVKAFLSSHGVPTKLMKIESHGSRLPLVSNSSAEGRQLNRRVEIVVNPEKVF